MLFTLIILLASLYYLIIKRPKITALNHRGFPNVSKDHFDEWKLYELSSINFFLWASFGILLASIFVGFASRFLFPNNPPAFLQYANIGFFGLFVILVFISAIQGSKAKSIKAKYGIRSNPGVETTNATSPAYKKSSVHTNESKVGSKVNLSDLASLKPNSEQPEFIAPKSPADQAALAASKLLAFTIISMIVLAVGYFVKFLFDRYYD
jgi:hypothetical protein